MNKDSSLNTPLDVLFNTVLTPEEQAMDFYKQLMGESPIKVGELPGGKIYLKEERLIIK